MHTTHSNTQYKNESKHSEMGPVRQNPIQRSVSLFICVCIALCTIIAHNIAQNRPDSFPSYAPDNHHCSDDVYLREGLLEKATREYTILPCGVCHRSVGRNSIQCIKCQKWVHRKCSGIKGSMIKVSKCFVGRCCTDQQANEDKTSMDTGEW